MAPPRSRFSLLLLLLPAWAAVVFYLPTLAHGYVWDDRYFLVDLPYLRDPELWWQAVREPLFVSQNYFRPLPLLMFVAESRLGGPGAFVFHLVNVLLHAFNAALVAGLARAVLPRDGLAPALAAGAGLLFALHPALVENVSWISDRFDLLMTGFILLALHAELRLQTPLRRTACQAACLLGALLCKETGAILLLLLPLWQLFLHVDGGRPLATAGALWRQSRRTYLTLGGVLLAYLGLRYAALGFLYQSDTQMAPGTLLQHLLLVGKTFATYLLLLVFPFGQVSPVHPVLTPLPLSEPSAWLGLVLLVALLAAIVVGLRRGRPAAVLAAMALLALAPVSNLLPLTIGDNLAHDRYLIVPVALIALLLARLLHAARSVWPRRLAAVWLLAAAICTALLVPRWESNLSLWSWAYEKHPQSQIAGSSYLLALVEAHRHAQAISLARRLLESELPATVEANLRHSLALALERSDRLAEAEREIKRCLDVPRRDDALGRHAVSEALNLLAHIQLRQGRSEAAEANLREAIRLTPHLPRPHYNLARLLYARGMEAAGDAELAAAVRSATPAMGVAFRAAVRQSAPQAESTGANAGGDAR